MLEDFIKRHSGKLVSYDNVPQNAGQSMQLIATWCRHIGLPFRWPAPSDWWNDRVNDIFYDHWLRYEYDNGVVKPIPGDVVIFDTMLPGSDNQGHASIFVRLIGTGWEGFDADWGGEAAHIQSHTWSHVLGWFTPKRPIQPPAALPATGQLARSFAAAPILRPNSNDTVQVLFPIPKYSKVTDALNGANPIGELQPTRYYVYRHLHGMMSVTLKLGQPAGIWINPSDLQPKLDPMPEPEKVIVLDAEMPDPEELGSELYPLSLPEPSLSIHSRLTDMYRWHDKIYALVKQSNVLKKFRR